MSTIPTENRPPPAPPRVVAISGMIFAALYIASLVLARLAVPADPREPGAWLADPTLRSWVRFALNLIPFTGIAFLWFMAVLRNRIGLRTAVLSRWVSFVGFAFSLVLLLVITDFAWIALLFPLWALLVSTHVLIADIHRGRPVVATNETSVPRSDGGATLAQNGTEYG